MNPLWTIYSNLLIQQRTELGILSAEYTVDEQDSIPILEYHTAQGIARASHRSFGQHTGRLLERRRRNERLGRQRGLGDTQQDRLVSGRTLALGFRTLVFGIDPHSGSSWRDRGGGSWRWAGSTWSSWRPLSRCTGKSTTSPPPTRCSSR